LKKIYDTTSVLLDKTHFFEFHIFFIMHKLWCW